MKPAIPAISKGAEDSVMANTMQAADRMNPAMPTCFNVVFMCDEFNLFVVRGEMKCGEKPESSPAEAREQRVTTKPLHWLDHCLYAG